MTIKWHEPRIVDDKWLIDMHGVTPKVFHALSRHEAFQKGGVLIDYTEQYARFTFRKDVVAAHTSRRCVWWLQEDILPEGETVDLNRQWELAIGHALVNSRWQGSDFDDLGRRIG